MVREVALSDIVDNPFQPRGHFDPAAIQSLADEIKAEGFWNTMLQGRKTGNGKVQLVFGHRRLRALRLLKLASIKMDLVDLSDAQMSMRALEENLQREGLTDLEKADAVKKAVELVGAERNNVRGAMTAVAERIGVHPSWVSALCDVSSTIVEKDRAVLERSNLNAKAALMAKKWGGDEYLRTLAKQSKAATTDGSVAKPTEHTVAAMKRAVSLAPENVQEKLKEKVVKGDYVTPKEVESGARKLAAQRVRHEKPEPPDLKVVITGWIDDLKDWNEKLKTVLPYMDYIDESPGTLAPRFRGALETFVKTAQTLLKAAG